MADVRKTIEVAYQADVTQLLGNLKKIPGMTDKEAKKMVQALSTQLRQTEKAAKKAAQTNSKAMKQMGDSAKQTRKQFQQMKRSASQMGAGLGELASLAGESDSAIGQMANNAGLFAMSASALLPLLGGLKGAIMSLGASAAMATGGLTVVAGAVALLVANMGGVDEEAKKQTEEIKKLDEQYKQLNNDIQQIIIKNAEFRKSLQATLGGIRELEQEFIEQELELQFKLGKISQKDFEEFLAESKIQAGNERIKVSFDEREKALRENIRNEEAAMAGLIAVAQTVAKKLTTESYSALGGASVESDLRDIEKASKHVNEQSETRAQLEQRIKNILAGRPEEYIKELVRIKEQKKLVASANHELQVFNRERFDNEKRLQDRVAQTVKMQTKIDQRERNKIASEKAKAKQKEIEVQEEQRLAQLAGQRQQLSAALFNLEKDKASEIDKINMDIDKQIEALQTLAEKNKSIATDQTEQLDITRAVTLLEEKRKQQIEEVTQKMKEQGTVQQQNREKQAINDLIKGYKNQEISLFDLYDMENELRNNKETAETALHLKVMEMIAAEHNARLQGSKELLGNLQTFTQARLTMIQNTEDADQKAITRAFYLNQAASAASVAFTTSENIVKALGMAATNPILAGALAATASAAGAAQIGAIMSTPPPQKKHMGGIANDERNFTLLQGEAVLSRAAARRIGEQGIRRIEDGKSMTPEVVVISPFKHYDRFVSSRNRRVKTKTVAAGGY